MQKAHIEKLFETPLGSIRCGFKSDKVGGTLATKRYERGSSEIYTTAGHSIELISFKINARYNFTDSFGWIFRIEKKTDIPEEIEAYCFLDEAVFDTATGEYLDAIQAENEEWTLHIGTEDGEMLNIRAEQGDWFPPRLKNEANPYQSITVMKPHGFVAHIPHLNKGEKIHLQYLTAYDKKDSEKINTWLAVDVRKKVLEDWIGITNFGQ